MEIQSIGYNDKKPACWGIIRPYGLDDVYTIMLIRSKSVFYINKQKIKAKPNSLIIFDKDFPQQFYSDNEIFVNDWMHFDISEEERNYFFSKPGLLNTLIEIKEPTIFSELIKAMQKEWASVNTYKNETINLYFKLFFVKLDEQLSQNNLDVPTYNSLVKIRSKIYNYPSNNYTVTNLASIIGVSNSHFQLLYKKYFNITPIADVIASRMIYAKQLLSSSNYTVADIAEMLEYSNTEQFIKQFKLTQNMTPLQYRKQIRS